MSLKDLPNLIGADVVEATEAFLRTLPAGQNLSTLELMEALWPAKQASNAAITTRKNCVDHLLANVDHFCRLRMAERGPLSIRKYMGKRIRPWIWHSPGKQICPHCGKEI